MHFSMRQTLAEIKPESEIVMRVYKLLDMYCCEGGASMGYHKAGFNVVGVDIKKQPRYPFEQLVGDAIITIKERQDDFDAFHASPPCQAFTRARKLQGNEHFDLIGVTRDALVATGKPFVIENVPGAPLKNPTLLCGLMFGLNFYRHRLFESNIVLDFMFHPPHHAPLTKLGLPPKENEILQTVGHFSGVPRARREMQTPWMSQFGMAQCIPPAYTEWIGRQIINALENKESGFTSANNARRKMPRLKWGWEL
jgi:DNA (cytosine-5)-methyltransferase 1